MLKVGLKSIIDIMKKIIKMMLALLFISNVNAQNDEQSSLYGMNTQYYNAGYAGSRNSISASLIGRYQWAGFKGAPKTGWFSISAPIMNRRFGIGGHFISDNLGARKRTSGYLDLSGSIKLNDRNDRVALGISIGVDNIQLNYTNLYVIDVNDPMAAAVFNKTTLNSGAGLYFYGSKYYFGVSVPRFIKNRSSIQGTNYGLVQPNLFVTGGYVFKLNSIFNLKTTSLVKLTKGSPIAADLNLNLICYDKLNFGVMYRYNESVGVNFSILIKDVLTVGYAFDFPINKLIGYQAGSHELGLQLDIFKYKKQNNQYSPRYF